jgi:hypothetical protein
LFLVSFFACSCVVLFGGGVVSLVVRCTRSVYVNNLFWSKPPTCRGSLTNFIVVLYRVHLVRSGIWNHNVSGDRHLVHR